MAKKIFEKIQNTQVNTSGFDLSHDRKLSTNFAKLTPFLLNEIVPGDKFSVNSEVMVRLAPMLAPVMHRMNVYTHFFFVPNRLVWKEWNKFITGGDDGLSAPALPVIKPSATAQVKHGSLWDHFGLPSVKEGTVTSNWPTVSRLPFRAYQLIFNEYYRDQNLVDELDIEAMGDNELLQIRTRAWEKDYFTSALPFAQKGPAVPAPLTHNYVDPDIVVDGNGDPIINAGLRSSPAGQLTGDQDAGGELLASIDNTANLGMNINDLRTAHRLQRWLEKQARGGSRYIETILNHFGVQTKDSRLQRPEYLGGNKAPVVVSEVLNTSETEEQKQGHMSGHGISVNGQNGFEKRFTEHGYVIGILSVLPTTAYQQGIDRHWKKWDKHDFFWPEYANLGEQSIRNDELYWDFEAVGAPTDTWGYQQRFAEYKYQPSKVAGDFKEDLDFWHMGRIFDGQPNLNKEFVYPDAETLNRIFAVDDPTIDKLWINIYNRVQAVRPMPYFADPRL